MKVNCQKEDLLYAVQAVARAVSAKNTLPVLGGIMIVAEEGRMIFRATDLEMAMECIINADVPEEGMVVVPGKYFNDLVRHLPSGDICLESLSNQQMMVSYEQSQISVHCFDSEEFPSLPQVEGHVRGEIPTAVFRRLVKQVSIAAASDEIRPIFTGLLTKIYENKLVVVATDTHRLAIGEGSWQGKGETTAILPNRTMQEIARLAVNDEEPIVITAGRNQVYFSLGNITFVSRIINGQYPDYRQVLPMENLYVSRAVVNRQRLLDALERASLLSRDAVRGKGNIVKLHWKEDILTVSADVPDVGYIKEDMVCFLQGEEMEANYNARYLIEALRVIEEENVIIRLTGPTTPGIILPDYMQEGNKKAGVQEEEPYIYLILPVRISN